MFLENRNLKINTAEHLMLSSNTDRKTNKHSVYFCTCFSSITYPSYLEKTFSNLCLFALSYAFSKSKK